MSESTLADDSDQLQQKPFSGVLTGYRPLAAGYDEAVEADGILRPGWKTLFDHLACLTRGELDRRLSRAQRQMDVDGVAFNPHDTTGVSRPWSLDPIPLVLQQAEWRLISEGLEQRAKLSDLMLLDLLGPQTLLHEKILPPEALFAHPRYFPAYHSLVPRPQRHLHLAAADLARSSSGQWWVTADRTRCPFGLGYILENRLVASRMLPVAFGNCHVQRLAPFFMTLQQTLRDLAKRYKENPRIAIWSKGPKSRAYFEDAFLARYLGYALVEGDDLAVRDNKVMLKTLGGLLPVEVLLRRVEDQHCDSAELAAGENFGVSGLLEVIRGGNVSVANSIGSGLSESPMLMAFMSSVCRHFLDQDLLLPSLATWWCGRPDALTYVLSNLDKLVIRRAYRSEDEPPYQPLKMSAAEKSILVDRIRAAPTMFVGQELVARSTAPVWEGDRLQAWPLAIRAFMVAKDDGYETLPGALARVSPNPDVLLHNMTSGEKSQDVWIVSDQPQPVVSLLAVAGAQLDLKRGGTELPSRAADNLFWLGRNLERAEQLARLVRLTLQQLTSEDVTDPAVANLAYACRQAKQLPAVETKAELNYGSVTQQLIQCALDSETPTSLRSVVKAANISVMKVRDRVALDSLRVLNDLGELFEANVSSDDVAASDLISILDVAITSLNALSGLASESMTRTQGWRFLDLGRRIERTFQTARTIRSLISLQFNEVDPARTLECLLQICDSFMTYRNRYLANLQLIAVLDLLIADETNPRSILFQLQVIHEHVECLPRSDSAIMNPEQRIALSQYNSVRLSDVQELAARDHRGEMTALHKSLGRIMEQMPKLSDTISGRFLIHAGLQRHLASSHMLEDKSRGGTLA